MELTGEVMAAHVEEREMTSKTDGKKRIAKISHVLLKVENPKTKVIEVCNVRAFDAKFPLPDIKSVWTSPRVKKYENFGGTIAEVLV